MGGLLGIAASGLLAAQRALTTTSHNIANANTEGYSRQRVEQTERDPSWTGAGYVGNGAQITSITRAYDSYLTAQVRNSQASHSGLDAYHSLASKIDEVIDHADTGLAPVLQSFFTAVNGVANDPSSIPAREVLLAQGDSLAQRFGSLDQHFDDLRGEVNQTLASDVGTINNLASGIANLNTQIITARGQGNGQPPNDLLDQRDQLVAQLTEKVGAQVFEQQDGSFSVIIGNGQSLVTGGTAGKLALQSSVYDPNTQDITLTVGSGDPTTITQTLSGGEVGGLLQFQSEMLDPTQNSLGRIAAGLAVSINSQHRIGTNLNGAAGQNFFTTPTGTAYGKTTNTGTAQLTVGFDNTPANTTTGTQANTPALLTGSDYQIDFSGTPATASITRLSDHQPVTPTVDPATGSLSFEGLKIDLSGTAQAGDSFLIRPFRTPAGDMEMAITDTRAIAAAGATPTGPGDNSNARALADLQTARTLVGGKASFQTAYSQLVGEVGGKTQAADIASASQKKLLDQATQSKESLSGVNLDEEASSLIRFQQAYQASAQLIPVLNDVFNSLITAVRS